MAGNRGHADTPFFCCNPRKAAGHRAVGALSLATIHPCRWPQSIPVVILKPQFLVLNAALLWLDNLPPIICLAGTDPPPRLRFETTIPASGHNEAQTPFIIFLDLLLTQHALLHTDAPGHIHNHYVHAQRLPIAHVRNVLCTMFGHWAYAKSEVMGLWAPSGVSKCSKCSLPVQW